VTTTVETYDRLDYACNSAGIEGTQAHTADYPGEIWNRATTYALMVWSDEGGPAT
jgi:hypothetical protein